MKAGASLLCNGGVSRRALLSQISQYSQFSHYSHSTANENHCASAAYAGAAACRYPTFGLVLMEFKIN